MKSKLTGWSVVFTLLVPTFAFAFDQTSRHQEGLRENVPSVYALVNAKIVISPDTTLEHGTVIIANGKITAVGNEIEIPKHARVVDYSGHVIYPGFIDSMTTADVPLPSKDRGVYWNRQISPERKAAVELNPDDGKYRQAGFAARLIAPDSGILKGQSVLVLTGDQSVERRVLNANVFQHARLTVSRGGGRDRYPNSPMGAVALARQAMYDAQWYGAALKAFDAAPQLPKPEWNRSLEALQPVLELEQPLVVDTSNEILALRADRFAREFEISLILNGSGNEYRRLDAIAATGRPILLPVDFPSPPNVATREAAKTVTLEQLMNWDLAPENPARLHQAGVQFTLTTRGLDSPKDFWAQVRKAVERGLPESVALDALTRIPAKLCRVESQLGTLEKGKFANLVVFKESPFIHDAEAVDTWVAGERYEVNPAEKQYAAGNWSFRLGREFQVHLEVEGDDDRLSAEAFVVATDADATEVENAERVKVSKIGMEGYRLSALLPGSLMDKAGVTRLTVILNPKNLDQAEGFVSDADGRDWRIVAKRSIASEMSE
ncbi:MAG: amidohydrolase family protein [Planctomycetota bacterium]|nr:amidohydrolase family protein [Planctomycetota bacterium]